MEAPKHRSLFRHITSRELNGFRVRKRAYMDGVGSDFSEVGAMAVEHSGVETPPMAVSFCKTAKNSHILALSDEDGYVSMFDTRRKFTASSSFEENAEKAKISEWVAHQNAVFDVCWIKEDTQVLTASGDQTMKLWDVLEQKCIGVLMGHTGSVKSMCSHPTNADVVVSGSRDGSFCLWDLRCKTAPKSRRGEPCICSTAEVKGAHLSSQSKRVRSVKAASKSITSVLYLKDQVSVATAGAVDSVVKFWDTRNLRSSVTQTCPRPQTTETGRFHGISSLSQDQSGVFLSASCMDNRIYLYDVLQLEKGPLRSFSGCRIESFFVKSAISPDATHIASGSSDGNAYVWQVNKPQEEPITLKTHEGEVTAVDWCHSEDGKLATSSDDFTANATNSGLVGQTEKIDLEERESRTLENLAEANDNFSSLTATESPEEGIHNESEEILYRKSSMGSQRIEKDYKAEIFNKEVTYILDTPLSMHERKDVTIADNILDKSSNSEDSGDKQIPEIESDSVSGGQSIIHESTRTEKSEVPVAEKMLEPDNLGKFESTSNKAHEEVRTSGEVIQLEPHEEGDKEYIDTLIKESEGIKQATVSDEAAHLKTVERDFEFVQEVHCYEVFTELVDKEKHTKTELSHPEENQYETTTAAGKTTNTQVSDEKKSEAIEIGDHEHIKDDLPVDIKGKNVTEAAKSLIRENEGTETIIAGETEVMARGTKEPSVTVNRSQKGHTDKVEVSEYTKEIEKREDSSWETVDINLTEKADVDTRKNNEEDVQERPQNQDEETKREVQVREESNLQRSTEEHQLEEATPKTTQSEEAKIDSEIDEDENRKIEPLSGASAMVETSADKDVKVAHKKSHNILSGVGSKVKHSISKVKKAITGKSSHPKTASPK